MGGLIRGFIGGVGGAMAEIGKMEYMRQAQEERDEAMNMRERALQRDRQSFQRTESANERGFRSAERGETRAFTDKQRQERVKDEKSLAQEKHDLKLKEIEHLAKYKPDKSEQLIKYTDQKGFEQEGILRKREDGSFVIVKPDTGEEIKDPRLSREELQNAAALLNTEEDRNWFFTRYDPSDDKTRVRALKEREKQAKPKSGGVVGSKMTPETGSETAGSAKAVDDWTITIGDGNRQKTIERSTFNVRMKRKYPDITDEELDSEWDALKTANRK